ncbi:MAG: glycosyltransferase [Ignavibacteriota bacterium]
MRISIVSNIFSPHVRGGYELGCETIAERLVERGHIVDILTSGVVGRLEKTRSRTRLNVRRIFAPIFEYEELLNAHAGNNPFWQQRRRQAFGGVVVSNAAALANCLAEDRPDVVWIFNPLGLGPIGVLEASLTTGAKCIIHLMDNIDSVIVDHAAEPYYAPRLRRLKRSISAISCSRKILIANSRVGLYQSHRIIYNGVDFGAIPCGDGRQKSGLFRFVYFGQVEEVKGVANLIDAIALLRRDAPQLQFELTIIGRGSEPFKLRLCEQIAKEKLGNCVRLLGFLPRDEFLPLLKDFDAAVMLLSSNEPFAYAPVEAAAAGLPVIQTTGAGNVECLPSDYPLLIESRTDTQKVASLLRWCVMHRAELPRIGMALREHMRAACDLESIVLPSYLRVLETCRPSSGRFNITDLLASNMTATTYGLYA